MNSQAWHTRLGKMGRILEFTRERRLPIALVRKRGRGGVDKDVRFNSQQRGTGGGREIKISRNKRT